MIENEIISDSGRDKLNDWVW